MKRHEYINQPEELIVPLVRSNFLLPNAAGGKASALSELIGNGYNVPNGFVVTISAIQKLVEAQEDFSDLLEIDQAFRKSDNKDITDFAEKQADFITNMSCPSWFSDMLDSNLELIGADSYAVRSSAAMEDGANQSWAGVFDSFLDVHRQDIFRHICHCCASCFNDRSLAYRENIVPSIAELQFAVVVQEMIPAQISCIVFSEDPADSSKVRVEAAKGLGPSLVSGQTVPDTYLLDRSLGVLVELSKGTAASKNHLPAGRLSQIYEIAMGVEVAFGFPVDIELAITDERISVLQARQITSTGSNAPDYDPKALPNIADYQLTFKVQGLDFLFSDMLAKGFYYLEPLFVSINGDFRQYFPRRKMHWATLEGYRWLSEESGFDDYESSFREFIQTVRRQLSTLMRDTIDSQALTEIFDLFSAIMNRYSRMDFQFTNLVWQYAETDQTIAANLEKLSKFKDDARTWLNEILLEESGCYEKIVSHLADKLRRTSLEVVNMSVNEIAIEIEHGQSVHPSLIETRKKSFAIYVADDLVHYLNDTDMISEKFSHMPATQHDNRKLFGQVANQATDKIEGVVRIINVDYADAVKMRAKMDEMNVGEILVSEFTAPELLPACKKALAIVTDLGGMLSHAAIVSRELGIPCLVGTGEAASTFKTGDNVVIDFSASCIYRNE